AGLCHASARPFSSPAQRTPQLGGLPRPVGRGASRKLNRDILADEYFADMQVHIGSQVEVDIARLAESPGTQERSAGSSTTLAQVWAPPATDLVLPTAF